MAAYRVCQINNQEFELPEDKKYAETLSNLSILDMITVYLQKVTIK